MPNFDTYHVTFISSLTGAIQTDTVTVSRNPHNSDSEQRRRAIQECFAMHYCHRETISAVKV